MSPIIHITLLLVGIAAYCYRCDSEPVCTTPNEDTSNQNQTTSTEGTYTRVTPTLSQAITTEEEDEPSDNGEPYWLQIMLAIIEYWGGLILLILGIPGNLLAFLVLLKKKCRRMPGITFLITMTLADAFIVFLFFLTIWIQYDTQFDFMIVNNWTCNIANFSWTFSLNLSRFSLLAFTVERFVSICFPFKARSIVSQKVRNIYMITLTSLVLLLCIFDMTILKVIEIQGQLECNYSVSLAVRHFRLGLSLSLNLIPGIGMAICNTSIVIVLWRQMQLQRWKVDQKLDSDTKGVTQLLLTVSFVYIFLTTPQYVTLLLMAKGDFESVMGIYENLFSFLLFTNHSINVVLYLISGKTFRREMAALLCQAIQVCRKKSMEATSQSETPTQLQSVETTVRDSSTGGV